MAQAVMIKPDFYNFQEKDSLAAALAEKVATILKEAALSKGQASFVVSGGSTPVPFFRFLSEYPIPWGNITTLVADERWVSPESDDSNEKLVRMHLTAASATLCSLAPLNGSESVHAGAKRIESILAEMKHPFDVVILGMGEDGHTASLFPNHPQLKAGLDATQKISCLPVTDSPKPPAERITLTANRLLSTRHLFLHITGEAKKRVYEQALHPQSREQDLPIRHFIHQDKVPLQVYWAA